MVDQCSNCDYVRPRTYGTKTVLECRFGAPSTTYRQGQTGAWAEVKPDDWCGEYQVLGASDPVNWKVEGITLNTLTKTKVAGTAGYLFYITGVNITNTSINKSAMVKFFDGDSEDVIGINAISPNQSGGGAVFPPTKVGTGEVWVQLMETDGANVYVYVQGKKGPAAEVQQT